MVCYLRVVALLAYWIAVWVQKRLSWTRQHSPPFYFTDWSSSSWTYHGSRRRWIEPWSREVSLQLMLKTCLLQPVSYSVWCDVCGLWLMAYAYGVCVRACVRAGVNEAEYYLSQSDDTWCCPTWVKEAFPFHDSSIPSPNQSFVTTEVSDCSSVDPPVFSSNKLTICYANCRSLVPKLNNLQLFALSS